MSDASVISDVSETLRSILDAHLNPSAPGDPGSPPGVGAPVTVTVDNPQRSGGEDLRVNLYLYHILQDESRRNTGRLAIAHAADSATFVPEPLPLKLYYMVTAFAPDGRTEHRLIGEVIQAFYSNRILDPATLRGGLATSPIKPDRIQLVLLNQDLETLHRIWGNFQEALRPSATYEVDGVYLDARPAIEQRVRLVEQRAIDVVAVPFLSDVSPGAARRGATVRLRGVNLDLRSPDGATSLVRILLNGAPIAPIADRRTNRAVSLVVPPTTPIGEAMLQVQIDDYTSRTVVLQVLP
ncbi:MAG TPA: DUF4255 domain-containing protein [Kofleriaceae bacterium]|jgi:hypothetical protein